MAKLSAASQRRLDGAHPLLQQVFTAVAPEADIVILDSQRGRAAQERAHASGNSRAHFGQSPHNWSPAIALDVAPWPIDWTDLARGPRQSLRKPEIRPPETRELIELN